MGAPIGNKNAKGNRGGGRKSAFQERQEADLLYKLWTEPINVPRLKRKIMSGKYTALDMYVYKIMTGNDRLLVVMFNKLFPNPPRARQSRTKEWRDGKDLESLAKSMRELRIKAEREARKRGIR